jgi:hypothetical protein
VFLSSGPRFLVEVGSSVATCHMAPSSASSRGELWRCHVFLSSRPRLAAEVSSGAAICPMALSSTSSRGELWCCHVPHDPHRVVHHRNKEMSSCPRHTVGLACFQSTLVCYRGVCKTCGHAATVRFNSATSVQLTTSGRGYSGDTTRQDGTTTLAMFSTAG